MMIIKERCSQMCINCVLATITWIGTVCLVAPLASITATINVKYVKDSKYTSAYSHGEHQINSFIAKAEDNEF